MPVPEKLPPVSSGLILPLRDGAEHRQRKELLMAAFTREALGSVAPGPSKVATW